MKNNFKAIMFDLDGTIINTLPLYVEAYNLTYKQILHISTLELI